MARRILIVDDQPGIRMLLTDVLTDQGYEVITAQTGTEALEKISMENLNLIILDYQLPLLSGKEVLHKLEEEQYEIPAILMSGLVENIKRKEIKYQYLKEVLGKPFSIHKVIELVAHIVSD
ncbi:response regulator [Virgibacillus halodenitrificans]|uniref:Response regulator n=1 Tax=Virgibacillus halodenitrificans TaxID=1482 RepID=A0AAC9J364_VIRHA|nr:response regulator [Virgibacillus halodenitrificans]APC50327.1 response regulator [Virgibacillus halodenitrificans]